MQMNFEWKCLRTITKTLKLINSLFLALPSIWSQTKGIVIPIHSWSPQIIHLWPYLWIKYFLISLRILVSEYVLYFPVSIVSVRLAIFFLLKVLFLFQGKHPFFWPAFVDLLWWILLGLFEQHISCAVKDPILLIFLLQNLHWDILNPFGYMLYIHQQDH